MSDPKQAPGTAGGAGDTLRDPNAEISSEQARAEGLPEQKHAGAVGYGPNYASKTHPTIGDKFTGVKEQLVGKITKNPELAHKGHERRTGELKKKEQSENERDPFAKADGTDKLGNDVKENAPNINDGKSSGVDTAAGKSRLANDPTHPAAQDEGVQRAGTV